MTIAIIGSVALKCYYEDFRCTNDVDIVADFDSLQQFHKSIKPNKIYPFDNGDKYFAQTSEGLIYESEIAWSGSLSEELLTIIVNDPDSWVDSRGWYYASLNVLYMLKMSHRFKKNSPHFKKTMDDILLMRVCGAEILPEYEDFYKRRMAATYNYKHPSLKRSKENFFQGDGIEYEYDHDTIHEAVKIMYQPAYKFFSGGEVWSDMDKFETLTEDVKLFAVLEECLVLAAERSQLAFDNVCPDWSFEMALMKVSTSITSGRFRTYAWENYYQVMDLYKRIGVGYMDKVRQGIACGYVKRIKENV